MKSVKFCFPKNFKKRDYFAVCAMQSLMDAMVNGGFSDKDGNKVDKLHFDTLACYAYGMADSMIKAGKNES